MPQAADTNVFSGLKTLIDAQRQDQNTQISQQAALQQVQTGGIDAATKANAFKAQVLSAASAAGDQGQYEQGLAAIAQTLGPDAVSGLPADVASGKAYSGQLLSALTPVTKLLSTAAAVDSAEAARSGVTGQAPGPSMVGAVLSHSQIPGLQTAPAQPQGNLNALPATQVANMPTTAPAAASGIDAVYPGDAPITSPNPISGAPAPQTAVPQPVINNNGAKPFVPPAYDTTKTQAANKTAFEQAKAVYDADPVNKAATDALATGAKKDAENISDVKKAYDAAITQIPTVYGNFQLMREQAPNASYGPAVGLSEAFHQAMDDSTNTANTMVSQKGAQNTIKEIGPILTGAGVRGNKFLETLASQATALNDADGPTAKVSAVNGLDDTYTKGLKSMAAELRNAGQTVLSDAQIDELAQKARVAPSLASPSAPAYVPTASEIAAAKQAPDGKFYIPDPTRAGKYLQVQH